MARGKSQSGAAAVVLFLLCSVYFYRLFGLQIIDPRFDGWLGGDAISHYAGWLFYRLEPWGLPLGKFSGLLWPVGSLTLQTDSNTFFAVIFKALSPFLGEPFQYFGIWIFLCYFLQGFLSWKILRKFDLTFWEAIWGASFFICAPSFVGRMGHLSLCGHWLILAVFNLYFSKARNWKSFCWLIFISSVAILVHPYLFLMVFGLSMAFFASEVSRRGMLPVFVQALAYFLTSGFVCWLGGYFEKNDPTTDLNFGGYSADLLTFLNPIFNGTKFSILLPRLRLAGGQYEGFGFLGAGIVGVLAFLILYWRKDFFKVLKRLWATDDQNRVDRNRLSSVARNGEVFFLGWVGVLFFIYALSSKVTIAGNQIVDLSLFYDRLQPIPSIFRSSGRFVWPLYYLAILVAVVGLKKTLSESARWQQGLLNFRKGSFAAILCAIFIFQFFDSFADFPYSHPRLQNLESPISPETSQWFRSMNIKQVVFVPPYIVTGKVSCFEKEAFDFGEYRDWIRFIAREHLVFHSGVTSRGGPEVVRRCRDFWSDLPNLLEDRANAFVIHPKYKDRWQKALLTGSGGNDCKHQGPFEICLAK